MRRRADLFALLSALPGAVKVAVPKSSAIDSLIHDGVLRLKAICLRACHLRNRPGYPSGVIRPPVSRSFVAEQDAKWCRADPVLD
ncbi:MAG TPA: hypothetical protein VK633_07010 [Verrucomicrobiae bacterium]|nr:hypothetical protein [Verrucomicrobiae bacterium]